MRRLRRFLRRLFFRRPKPPVLAAPVRSPLQHVPIAAIRDYECRIMHMARVPRRNSNNPNAYDLVHVFGGNTFFRRRRAEQLPDNAERWFVAEHDSVTHLSGIGDTATQAAAHLVAQVNALIESENPPCAVDCPKCERIANRTHDDFEDDFGPYLGSLGGLDTEFVERQPKLPAPTTDLPTPFPRFRR